MRALINVYACSPNMGSEPGMAWNWCVHLAKHCELHIITEGEFRDKIEKEVIRLPQGNNMHFYYNPVPQSTRDKCWNQGNWSFYPLYKKWQKKTAVIARSICKEHKIDIFHQLNMIGFREPGYLWEISKDTGIPFVWGPIGGLKQFPEAYLEDAGWKMSLFNKVKNRLNVLQIKYDKRVNLALKNASVLISSIPDSYNALKKYKGLESIIIPETGCFLNGIDAIENRNFDDTVLRIIWVGKFDFRKRLDIALRSIAASGLSNVEIQIFGEGSYSQSTKAKQLAENLGITSKVRWMGNCPNDQVKEAMRQSHLFLFTSLSEDTSTVVLEAVSNHLPVLCFDTCGMGSVINDNIGIKVPLTDPKQSVKDFAEKIRMLNENRSLLKYLSENCRIRKEELSWDKKAMLMMDIYKSCLSKG